MIEKDSEENRTDSDVGSDLEQQNDEKPEKKKSGRIPLYVKFPTLIDVAMTFIKEHSFSTFSFSFTTCTPQGDDSNCRR